MMHDARCVALLMRDVSDIVDGFELVTGVRVVVVAIRAV